MSKNLKLSLVLIGFVFLPILLMILVDYYDNIGSMAIESGTKNLISTGSIFVSLIGCAVIIYLNKKINPFVRVWNIIPVILGLAFLLLLIAGLSVSKFGF